MRHFRCHADAFAQGRGRVKRLTDIHRVSAHLYRQCNLAITVAQLQGVLLLDGFLLQLVFHGDEVEVIFQVIALAGDHTHGLVHGHSNGQLPRHLARVELGFHRHIGSV